MRIKIINPNTSLGMTRTIGEAGRTVARPGTEVVAVSPTFGPASIESHYDEFLCAPGLLDEVRRGEDDGFDAFIVACFGDPALHACREITRKPVVGIAEAALYTASILAARFSILTLMPRVRTLVEEMVAGYGFTHRLASIRTTPLHVLDADTDPQAYLELLAVEARKAKDEDGAEAILLGCAGFADFADRIERELDIPVLDGVVCAVIARRGHRGAREADERPPHLQPPRTEGLHRHPRGIRHASGAGRERGRLTRPRVRGRTRQRLPPAHQ